MCRFIVISVLFIVTSVNAALLDSFEANQAPIRDFVQWVSHQSGKNIILGRSVDGVVSVQVRDLDSNDIVPFFKSVMTSNGYKVEDTPTGLVVAIDTESVVVQQPMITKFYKLNHLRNTKAKDVINSLLLSNTGETTTVESSTATFTLGKHSVDILPSSNSLLITATVKQIRLVDKFLTLVDTEQKQVLIEAVIMETDIGKNDEFSVNLSSALRLNGFSLVSNTATAASTDLNDLSSGGSIVYSHGGSIQSLITAVSQNTNTKILSTPNILVLDRESGSISVGQNVPFLVSTEVTDGGNTIQSIQREDVGVTLSVTPHILGTNEIILLINQESSSVSSSTVASDIITNKRSIQTVTKLKDGQTIVLGGLVSDETRETETSVPILRSIPFLGRLFRSESIDTVQREMTILIKAILI